MTMFEVSGIRTENGWTEQITYRSDSKLLAACMSARLAQDGWVMGGLVEVETGPLTEPVADATKNDLGRMPAQVGTGSVSGLDPGSIDWLETARRLGREHGELMGYETGARVVPLRRVVTEDGAA